MTTPPPDTKVQGETPEQIINRWRKMNVKISRYLYESPAAVAQLCEMIDEALRNERERALRDAARLECVFCAGADGFNPLPVGVEAGNYVHRNEPPNGQAGVYCKASRINDLATTIGEGR